jgi:hypothetical protein
MYRTWYGSQGVRAATPEPVFNRLGQKVTPVDQRRLMRGFAVALWCHTLRKIVGGDDVA